MGLILSETNTMALIEWRDEFRIGIDEVDFEHQELIELINESYDEAKNGNCDLAVLGSLGDVFEKISAHFALEEKEMRALKYDQYEDHKEDHEQLLDSIRDIMDEYEENNILNEEEFGERLKDWFVNHFSTKDARLHRFLQQ
jgi:hemerythrin